MNCFQKTCNCYLFWCWLLRPGDATSNMPGWPVSFQPSLSFWLSLRLQQSCWNTIQSIVSVIYTELCQAEPQLRINSCGVWSLLNWRKRANFLTEMVLIYPIRDICNLKLSVWNDLLLELKSSELLLRLRPAACQRSHRDFALTFYQVKAQCTFRCRSHDLTFGIPLGEKGAQPRKHETPLCLSNTCNHTLLQPVLQMFAVCPFWEFHRFN